jgi:pilus assembly protein FimV
MQSADFAAYRAKLAAAPRTTDAPRSGQTAAGSVGGRVEDRSAAAGGDQLRLSKQGAGAGGAAVGSQSSRSSTGEQDVARANALREANSRITDLEKNVNDLQKLVELKNRSMADLQKQLDEARAASKAVTGQVGAVPPAASAPAAKAEPPKAEAPKAELPKVEAPKAEASKAEAPKADAPAGDAAKAIAPPPITAPAPAPAPVAEAPKPPPAPPAPTKAPEPAPIASTSFVDDLLENPFVLPGLGGIALLGAGYGWYAMRRRRRVEKFEDSLIAADAFTSNSLFGSTGGQSVDTSNSVFAPSPANASPEVHSTEVDPIAEADVYIAYGREAQAEEILKEALKRQPERQAIRAKLLEIYSGRKDARTFETLAREMHEMTAGRNEEWPKVVTMGLSLDPTNPLYGGEAAAAGEAPSAGAIAAGAAALAAASASSAASSSGVRDEPRVPEMPEMSFDTVSPEAPAKLPAAGDTIEMAAASPDADDFPSLDFDLNLDTQIDKVTGQDVGMAGAGPAELTASLDERFDLPSLDLDSDARTSVPALDPAGSIDLDLPALESLTQTAKAVPELDLSPISLDLELLQEVIKGGDSGQQQKARAMLGKIG